MKHRNRLGFAAGVVTLLSAGLIMTLPANAETVQQTAAQSGHDIVVDAQGKVTDFTDEYTEAKGPLAGSNPLARSGNTVAVFDIGNSRYTQGDAIDVSSYQDWMTFDDFRRLRSVGVRTVVVKVSEGTGYLNPKAASEIIYARQAGMKVAVYHYAKFRDSGSGWNEGRHMADCLNRLGLPKNVLVFADMEHKTEPGGRISSQIVPALQSFWNALNGSGYRNHAVYTYESYLSELAKFNRGSITSTVGGNRNTWLAQYPFQPYRNCAFERNHRNQGYGAWQFSSTSQLSWKRKVNGWNKYIDLSHDYNGLLTNAASLPVARGQQQIDGHWYYFDANGMKTGFQWIADQKKTVYYGSNGQMQYGQKQINGKWYLFDRSTGAMKTGWQNLNGYGQNKTCYYASNGQMQYGQQCINGRWYLFDKGTGAMKTGFQNLKGYGQNKTCYYASNGQMQYGLQKINGYSSYYFNPATGAMAQNGVFKIGGRSYCYGSDGRRVSGLNNLNGGTYLSDSNGVMLTGLQKINGYSWYWFMPDGRMATNSWVTLNGRKYYYEANGRRAAGERKINGKWYLFKSDGKMSTGFNSPDGRKTCYYDSNGQMVYGLQKINGKWYWFNASTGARTSGWVTVNGRKHYFDAEGKGLTGTAKISGSHYYFNANGEMQTGWVTLNGKKYYYGTDGRKVFTDVLIDNIKYTFDRKTGELVSSHKVSPVVSNGWDAAHKYYYVNGRKYTGQKNIGGKWYLFKDGAMKTGFQWIPEQRKTCYYNGKGQMQYGQQHIGGKWYLFDKNTGAMKTGLQWISDQRKTCYYNGKGQMQYGQQHIGGKWYLFDKNTGAMKTGLQWISDQRKTCYYNGKGQMQYGQQHIGGKWYLFDKSTGAMKTGFQWIPEQRKTCYYNGNGQMQYGQQCISGRWYLFDKSTGAMKTGFQWIPEQRKTCYYNNNGQMLHGRQRINGRWYNFNRWTGALMN